MRHTLHCGSHVRFLPPFFYGCCVLYVFNAPLYRPLAKVGHLGRSLTELVRLWPYEMQSVLGLVGEVWRERVRGRGNGLNRMRKETGRD